jgi:hypothetical protein
VTVRTMDFMLAEFGHGFHAGFGLAAARLDMQSP